MGLTDHVLILPILIPFFVGAIMLLYDDRQRRTKLVLSVGSAIALLLVAIELLSRSKGSELTGGNDISFYLLGDWAVPYGIILVVDRLSAMMLVLVSLLAIPALLYSAAGWQKQGQHFHSMFQFLLMGLNGAFLTGDLFNLFVFFEVLLAASYGLLLHGSGQLRVRAGLNYIAINLSASLLFLVGVSLIYGVTGTLSMAQLSNFVPTIPEADRPLLHVGAAMLGLAFLVKAGIYPLNFWLPTAYMAGAAPVAAMFAIMTKVGVYIILRISMLVFGTDSGGSAGFAAEVLIALGMATIGFGMISVLASQSLGRMVGNLVLISSGTMLTVNGLALAGGGSAMLAGALYYMVASTIATSALFLLIEPISREEGGIAAMLALTADAYGLDPSDDDADLEEGLAIPGIMTVLGLAFGACLLVLAGMPPLAGFIGKVAMLSGVLASPDVTPVLGWTFVAVLIVSGLASLIGLVRIGIQTFWAADGVAPRVHPLEIGPILGMTAVLVVMSVLAQDTYRYMEATSRALHAPEIYVHGVMGAPRVVDGPAKPEVTQ